MNYYSERQDKKKPQVIIEFTGWQLIGYILIHAVAIAGILAILGYVNS